MIKGAEEAIWRRMRLILFTVTIPEARRDPNLLDKLRAEMPGILAWAVRGCLAWQERGLAPPDEVLEATRVYRADMDVLGSFLQGCCEIAPSARESAGALYDAYDVWCVENGEQQISKRNFGRALVERGFQRKKAGKILYRGLRLRHQRRGREQGEVF